MSEYAIVSLRTPLTDDEMGSIRRTITFGRQTKRTEMEVPISTLLRLLLRIDPNQYVDVSAAQMESLLDMAKPVPLSRF